MSLDELRRNDDDLFDFDEEDDHSLDIREDADLLHRVLLRMLIHIAIGREHIKHEAFRPPFDR